MARLSRKEFDALYGALVRIARGSDELCETTVCRALASGDPHLVARAAALVTDERRELWMPALVAAADHLFAARDPAKADPGCAAKGAVLEALDRLEYELEGPFRRGLGWIQLEGPYPQEDTAGAVRARSGLALIRLRVPDALIVAADLLCDPEPSVRTVGAEAVRYHGDPQGVALLRMKLHRGDPEPDVISAALAAYLRLDAEVGLALCTARLAAEAPQSARESAALALAEARHPAARGLLVEYLGALHSEGDTRTAVAALLLLRDPAGLAALRAFAAERADAHGSAAREALARYDRALAGED